MVLSIRTADPTTLRLLDALAAFWCALWLVVGVWTGWTVWQTSQLGDTVTSSGTAITSTGDALKAVGKVPVVGDRPTELGEELTATGADIADRGQRVESQLRQLAVLLGLAIALAPSTPLAGLYLPLRLARRREAAELREAVRRHGTDPAFERHLAEQALRHLSYDDAHALVGDPRAAIADGRAGPLADAELARLGVARPEP